MKSIVFLIGLCVSVDALHLRPVLAQVKGSNQTKGLDIYMSHNDSAPATKLTADAAEAEVQADNSQYPTAADAALTAQHHATWECGADSIPIDRNSCDSAVWCMCPKAGGAYPSQNDGGPIDVFGGQYQKTVLPKFPVAQKLAGAQKDQFEKIMGQALPKWEERCRAQWQPSCDQWEQIIRPMVDKQRRSGASCISRTMCSAALGSMSITWDKEWGMYIPTSQSTQDSPNELLSQSAHSYDTWVKSWQEYGPIAYGVPKKLTEQFPNIPQLKGKPWDNLRTWQGKTQPLVKSAAQQSWEYQQQMAKASGTQKAWEQAKHIQNKVKNGIPLGNHWN